MVEENSALVIGLDLPISTKHSIEICNFIRNKNIVEAKKDLNLVLEKRLAIPLRRFHDSRGHRRGHVGPGFFPEKATREILRLILSLEANVRQKGMNYEQVYLSSVITNKASRPLHHGRQGRRVMKRTHIRIMAAEKVIERVQKK